MTEKAWLDVSIFSCPKCGHVYADASWYAVELNSDIECGVCHKTFNAEKQLKDRVMLEFQIDEKGIVEKVKVAKHI